MKKTREKKQAGSSLFGAAGKSAIFGFLLTLILLLGEAALIVSGIVSTEMADEFVICCVLIGATFSGAHCAKIRSGGVITAGMTAAGIFLALILAVSVFTAKNLFEGSLTVKIIIASTAGGCFGGVLRLYRKTKKSKMRKKI